MRSTGLLNIYSEARSDQAVPDAADPVTVVVCNGKLTNRPCSERRAGSIPFRSARTGRTSGARQFSRCVRSGDDHSVFRKVTVSPLHN